MPKCFAVKEYFIDLVTERELINELLTEYNVETKCASVKHVVRWVEMYKVGKLFKQIQTCYSEILLQFSFLFNCFCTKNE